MLQDEIQGKLTKIIKKVKPDIDLSKEGNLFNTTFNCNTLDMVYILLNIQNEFGIVVDDTFVENIQNTTLENVTIAVLNAI